MTLEVEEAEAEAGKGMRHLVKISKAPVPPTYAPERGGTPILIPWEWDVAPQRNPKYRNLEKSNFMIAIYLYLPLFGMSESMR